MIIILVVIEHKVDTWAFSNNSMNIVFHRLRFKLWKILQETEIPGHLTCLLRNLFAGQEATVRIRHGKTDWFQIGRGVS